MVTIEEWNLGQLWKSHISSLGPREFYRRRVGGGAPHGVAGPKGAVGVVGQGLIIPKHNRGLSLFLFFLLLVLC